MSIAYESSYVCFACRPSWTLSCMLHGLKGLMTRLLGMLQEVDQALKHVCKLTVCVVLKVTLARADILAASIIIHCQLT